jgi:cytochrome b561
MSQSVTTYSSLSKIVHWVIAFAVIVMLSFGFFLDDIPDASKGTAYMLHKSVGLTILFLMVFRIISIKIKGRPPLPDSVKTWERYLSRLVQYSFYLLLLLMPLSGWILSLAAERVPSYFGLFNMPLPGIGPNKSLSEFMAESHRVIAWMIITLLFFHVAGALKHYFYDKDHVLQNMLPGKEAESKITDSL